MFWILLVSHVGTQNVDDKTVAEEVKYKDGEKEKYQSEAWRNMKMFVSELVRRELLSKDEMKILLPIDLLHAVDLMADSGVVTRKIRVANTRM